MRFLFVEDEESLQELYNLILSSIEVDFTIAKDGVEALELLENESFDVVFSDIVMPNMNGFQLLEKVREKEIKVGQFIFITAQVDVSENHAQDLGADSILYKPLAPKVLKKIVQEMQVSEVS